MEIYPGEQLAMLLSALLGGMAMGALWEAIAALRIVLGAYRPPERMRRCYARPLPLLGRCVPFEGRRPLGRVWRGLVIALGDLLFCLCFAVTVILILYRYHNGALRLSVPVLALLGFAAFHRLAVLLLSPLVDRVAYGLSALLMYFTAGIKLPLWGLLWRPACAVIGRVVDRRLRRRSAALCKAQLALARNGLADMDV
ncbi:MAG: spore cortex biosynthesis protein YabQ [Clostridia bacterium]|nr:spore cortex biosynthesis protein YabQ [Clostridia bacterium]